MLLFGRSFSLAGISLQTESGTVAQRAATLVALETETFAELRAPLTQRGHGRVYTVTVDDRVKPSVLAHFGHTGREFSLKINLANLENDCCTAAFLRGAFLACGTVSDKTVNAATQQIDAIRRLQEGGAIDTLPEELRELAALRVENPELSLRELGGLLHPPLTRSGVNHRLAKLIRLAEET